MQEPGETREQFEDHVVALAKRLKDAELGGCHTVDALSIIQYWAYASRQPLQDQPSVKPS